MSTAHALETENMSAMRNENGRAFEVVKDDPIPKPDEIKLYDSHGQTVRPVRPTIMARLDARGKEEVTLSRSTLWLLGAGVVILNLALSYGGSMIAWARQDQDQITTLKSVAESQARIERQLIEFDKRLRDQEIQAAKVQGFKTGIAAAEDGEK